MCGFNVTIPYKESIIEYLDDLDPISEKIGAVNTICFDNKRKTVGYNTDCYGFDITLKPFIRKNLNNALVLGTGGASKAVKYVLDKHNIKNSQHIVLISFSIFFKFLMKLLYCWF